MDKMQMANEYLLKIMSNSPLVDQDDIEFAVDTAWNYADAMQAEAEKRNPHKGLPRNAAGGIDWDKWQPDWSQAPKNTVAWSMTTENYAKWHITDSRLDFVRAPTFNYCGPISESLRKRP